MAKTVNQLTITGIIVNGQFMTENTYDGKNGTFRVVKTQLCVPQYVGEGKGHNNSGYESCFFNLRYKIFDDGPRHSNKERVVVFGSLKQSKDLDGKAHTYIMADNIIVLPNSSPTPQQAQYQAPITKYASAAEYSQAVLDSEAALFED